MNNTKEEKIYIAKRAQFDEITESSYYENRLPEPEIRLERQNLYERAREDIENEIKKLKKDIKSEKKKKDIL